MVKRPSYPRINCCVPDCKRGTTTFEPGTTMICGKCWRKAPKLLRQQWSHARRRGNTLDKKGDPRADIFHPRANGIFNHIREMLSESCGQQEGLPPLMAEELRKAGLV